MRNLFNSVKVDRKGRNKFGLSFTNYMSADYGRLYPCMIKECIPGDIWRISTENFVRAQPLACPAFTRSDVSFHYYFVPFRLVYEDWTKFIVRGRNGDTDYDKPYIIPDNDDSILKYSTNSELDNNSLADYLNFPSSSFFDPVQTKIDMMPFNCYNLIYNEYYRDENLIPEVFIWNKCGHVANSSAFNDYVDEVSAEFDITESVAGLLVSPFYLRRRAWRKDYFTSALPFLQKGPQVSLFANGSQQEYVTVQQFSSLPLPTDTFYTYPYWVTSHDADPGETTTHSGQAFIQIGASPTPLSDPAFQLAVPTASLQTQAMTISDLRLGLAVQQWFELNARTGSDRYFEYLLGHFGVRDRDSRLQRPEYLGGFTHQIQVSEVEQTSETGVTPQGNLAGKALGYAVNRPVTYRVPEWGYIMAIVSIRPHTPYYKGLPRMYQRWDAFDYYDVLFDHLSEMAIHKSELYYDWTFDPGSENDPDFGYTPQFSDMRTSLDEIHGDFRGSLNYWVSPRKIDSSVALDQSFIEIEPYSQELNNFFAFAGTSAKPVDHFLLQIRHNISVIRPMSKFGSPKF